MLMEEGPIEKGLQAGGQPVPQQPQPVPPEGVQAGGQCVPHPRERTRGWTCQR